MIDCIEFHGSKDGKGYGQFRVHGNLVKAHRMSYILFNGFIEPELQICHTCDNPSCINPKHLWQGTNKENQDDSVEKLRNFNTRKTHCKHGHPFNKENTRITKEGYRSCKECGRLHVIRQRAKK